MKAEQILKHTRDEMRKALDHSLHEFNTIHTGKASPAMVESLPVDAYGSTMQLKEVAAITTPDARTISIQPWDKNMIQPVEKAIQTANIGLNPILKGTSLICPLPDLSRERRQELVKLCHHLAEEGRIGIRAGRRGGMEAIKKLEKEGEISEDDRKRLEKEVQAETDRFNHEIEQHLKSKEAELMRV